MIISVPDTLTADNSEKYIVSIRLRPDGFSFSGHIPADSSRFFYRETMFDTGMSYVAALKETFFTHEFLTWNYKKFYIVDTTTAYTLVPDESFDEKRKEEWLAWNLSVSGLHCLHNPFPGEQAQLIFGMNAEVYEFCSRTLLNPFFVHSLALKQALWRKQNQLAQSRQMYLVVHAAHVDIACHAEGKLIFLNSFRIQQPEDILYYALYVWQQTGMNQVKDFLYIEAEDELPAGVKSTFQTYLQNVCPAPVPSEAYLAGLPGRRIPTDLISLVLCES